MMQASTPEDIGRALARGELELHYQPQLATATRRIVAAEALIRWRHPVRGLLGAGALIPCVEAGPREILASVCRAVLRRACRDTATLAGEPGVAVNVSARCLGRADLVEDVVEALLVANLAPHRLEIEVTESRPVEDTPTLRRNLGELRELGVRLALDDYGRGHADTEVLLRLMPDTVKLPRELISTITRGGAKTVRAALALARGLSIDVVAEGVETEAELAWLAQRRVPLVQGYLSGRPMALADYRTVVARGPERAVLSA